MGRTEDKIDKETGSIRRRVSLLNGMEPETKWMERRNGMGEQIDGRHNGLRGEIEWGMSSGGRSRAGMIGQQTRPGQIEGLKTEG
jgi:hypothetical protein